LVHQENQGVAGDEFVKEVTELDGIDTTGTEPTGTDTTKTGESGFIWWFVGLIAGVSLGGGFYCYAKRKD
jgi:hypothetical protein